MVNGLMTASEVAVAVGISIYTLNNWYKWDSIATKEERSEMPELPKFIQEQPRQPRYWESKDIWKLIEFKANVKKGRAGKMGKVSGMYYPEGKRKSKKRKEEENAN